MLYCYGSHSCSPKPPKIDSITIFCAKKNLFSVVCLSVISDFTIDIRYIYAYAFD